MSPAWRNTWPRGCWGALGILILQAEVGEPVRLEAGSHSSSAPHTMAPACLESTGSGTGPAWQRLCAQGAKPFRAM